MNNPLPWTAQSWYDEIVRRLKVGLFPSILNTSGCAYRAGERQCLLGILIPDDQYEERFEGITPAWWHGSTHEKTVDLTNIIKRAKPFDISIKDCRNIQKIHDYMTDDRKNQWDIDKKKTFLEEINLEFGTLNLGVVLVKPETLES